MVSAKEDRHRGIRKAPSSPSASRAGRRPVGVAVSSPNKPPKKPQPFSTSGSFANCWLKAQERHSQAKRKRAGRMGFEFMIVLELYENEGCLSIKSASISHRTLCPKPSSLIV